MNQSLFHAMLKQFNKKLFGNSLKCFSFNDNNNVEFLEPHLLSQTQIGFINFPASFKSVGLVKVFYNNFKYRTALTKCNKIKK